MEVETLVELASSGNASTVEEQWMGFFSYAVPTEGQSSVTTLLHEIGPEVVVGKEFVEGLSGTNVIVGVDKNTGIIHNFGG